MQFGRPAAVLAAMLLTVGCGGLAGGDARPGRGGAAPPRPRERAGERRLVASAAPGGRTVAPVAERQTLQYGYNPILAGTPMYIAQDRGYFAEQGLTSNLHRSIRAR